MSCLQALRSACRPPDDVTSVMTLPEDQQLPMPRILTRPDDQGPDLPAQSLRPSSHPALLGCPGWQQTGVSRLTSGRNRQTSATLLQPGHGGEPPPRPAHLPGGPRAGGVPHDCEALPVAGRPPSAGKPVAGALAGPARRPGRPGWRAASRSARGIQRRGHPGVLADPSGHGFASWAARRVIAAGDQAAAHAGCRESPGRGPGERPPCAQTCG